MTDLFSDAVRRAPFGLFDQVRAASPILHEPGRGFWMVFDYEGVRRVLSDHDTFSSAVPAPRWFIFLDPPQHTQLRGLISRAFTPAVVAGLEPRIRALSRDLLDRAVSRGEMDLAADYAMPLPMMVIAQLLGISAADLPRYGRWSDAILNMSYTIAGDREAGRAASAVFQTATAEMNDYVAAMLAERRAAPRDDLLTRLGAAEIDGAKLTQEEILGFFQLLLVAGQETTTNLINNAVLCLLENPDQLARLRAHPDLLPSAIEEVLRCRSPLQWQLRMARRDVTLHGQAIPAGTPLLPMIGSANRDPRVFPDAHRFDIARDPNPHLAFGHGVHFCLGAPLARLEAKIALADLLERLPDLRLASDEPWPPRPGLHVHGPASLPIRFTPTRPA